jgi:hypothetical protein
VARAQRADEQAVKANWIVLLLQSLEMKEAASFEKLDCPLQMRWRCDQVAASLYPG